ncbi:MAG: NADP-dependent malic enzyme [Patescibacteria group bacterium]
MIDYGQASIDARKKKNVLKIIPNVEVKTRDDLSTFYTPGIAKVSLAIAEDKSLAKTLTIKRNSVAIVSDGSAVLGLGNIGPEGAIPVMEGKALLMAEFAGLDAFPICLATQDTEEIIRSVKNIAPVFGAINLEDISAPRCFEIERRLQDIGIPVMHDDQHGTAVVVLAGLINALKVVGKDIQNVKIVISGAGAAGTAITKILLDYSESRAQIIVVDRQGSINLDRPGLSPEKLELAKITDNQTPGRLEEVIRNADVFIGVSAPNLLNQEMVASMAKDAIVFAMANPTPEIDPNVAKGAGARVVATGRSDFPNQINNVLAFPGIFRGALDANAERITDQMLLAAAMALANYVENPSEENIIPSPLDRGVVQSVSEAVKRAAK